MGAGLGAGGLDSDGTAASPSFAPILGSVRTQWPRHGAIPYQPGGGEGEEEVQEGATRRPSLSLLPQRAAQAVPSGAAAGTALPCRTLATAGGGCALRHSGGCDRAHLAKQAERENGPPTRAISACAAATPALDGAIAAATAVGAGGGADGRGRSAAAAVAAVAAAWPASRSHRPSAQRGGGRPRGWAGELSSDRV